MLQGRATLSPLSTASVSSGGVGTSVSGTVSGARDVVDASGGESFLSYVFPSSLSGGVSGRGICPVSLNEEGLAPPFTRLQRGESSQGVPTDGFLLELEERGGRSKLFSHLHRSNHLHRTSARHWKSVIRSTRVSCRRRLVSRWGGDRVTVHVIHPPPQFRKLRYFRCFHHLQMQRPLMAAVF